ncbi:hypothetical protein SKAU_G00093100 [Synaphobranchus kaupii]|uniref:Gag protein n=1 Tax=Synaphobranchus kaupii TaxID=118154 RepID=A0A9Q1FX87_SYNKA|nr:hypothetical protein SKAU_G00093100 [Synaphobranchus kaupii]
MAPLLSKGGRPQYIPWGSQDLQNLITTLPEIQDGAAIWIRKLEEEMMRKTMALGDVKALLTKVVGKEKMLDIIDQAGYTGAEKSAVDGRKFDQYRQRIWDSLRKAYPTRPSTAMLKGVPIKEGESAAAYVENQLRNWRMTLDRNIQGDPIMTAMFRAAILEGLPELAKSRLEEVVGLSSKTHREFVDHVIHAVERGRLEEKKQSNQEREVQRKLSQLQLEQSRRRCTFKGQCRGPHHKIGDKGTKGGLGTRQGIKGKGINSGDREVMGRISRGHLKVRQDAGGVGKWGI